MLSLESHPILHSACIPDYISSLFNYLYQHTILQKQQSCECKKADLSCIKITLCIVCENNKHLIHKKHLVCVLCVLYILLQNCTPVQTYTFGNSLLNK